MKQKLLKSFALAVLMTGGANCAWADNTVTVTSNGVTENYETLKAAIESESGILKTATADVTITISANQSLGDKVISWEKSYNLTITPTDDITIKGPNGSRWFTAKKSTNSGDAVNVIIGSAEHSITLDGENKTRTADLALRANPTNITFKNVVFKNFDLNSVKDLIVGENQDGIITLDGVTISNCKNPAHGFIYNQRVVNDRVVLKNYLNIDNDCIGNSICATAEYKSSNSAVNGRIKIDGNDFTASNIIKINGSVAIVRG